MTKICLGRLAGHIDWQKGGEDMDNNVIVKDDVGLNVQEVLKATALLYLKDALVKQEYEYCKELIDIAKELGVQQGDINEVLTSDLNADAPKQHRRNKPKNRVRF